LELYTEKNFQKFSKPTKPPSKIPVNTIRKDTSSSMKGLSKEAVNGKNGEQEFLLTAQIENNGDEETVVAKLLGIRALNLKAALGQPTLQIKRV
jgi:hypothetical protein